MPLLRIATILLLTVVFSAEGRVFAQPAAEPSSSSTSTSSNMVKAIDIRGQKSISISSILSKIKTRVGQDYLQSVISDDLKRLYNTGNFSDVSVDREDYEGGTKVIITVVEKPIVDKITFSRTRQIKSHTLLSKIQTKQGKFLDNKILRDDVNTIKEFYSKKGLTMASVEIETTIDPANNKAKVHFVIKEGEKIKVRHIYVYGNKAFREKKILKVIKSRWAWLFNSGYLQEDILREDMERIHAFYEHEGYIDVKVNYALDYQSSGNLVVNIHIDEGKQYFIETVDITGYSVITEQEIRATMTEALPGKVFSRDRLGVDINNIQTFYFDKGYIFSKVDESTSLNNDTGKVNMKLTIREGELAYVNQIQIQGNTRTRDIVVRRELKLYPGDRFDGSKLRRSKERLKNLGYFEDISYDVQDTDSSNKKDLIVQVKEAKTGTFSFGGGFSTVDQVVGFVEIEQRNFDFANWPTFTGGGQQLSVRAETGSLRSNQRLSFTEPWLFDYPISGGFDLYRIQRQRDSSSGYAFDQKTLGGDLRLGKQFSDYVQGDVVYKRENITIENFDTGVSADLLAEEGENTVSSVGVGLSRDTRDSMFNPTKGLYLSGGADLAGGPFGGDKDFYRLQSRATYDIPLKFDSVLEFRVHTGIVDEYGDSTRVPIFERFFAGGARSIRGYDERKVGPIDAASEDPTGGEALLVGNIEYIIPLVDFLKLATFFDVGNVWTSIDQFGQGEYKSGFGLGFRVKTPIGPINLDYGYPLNDEPGEEERSGKFYFSISRGF